MTELECRMKYKSETGENPTYGRYEGDANLSRGATMCNYEGGLTPEYAMWLENRQNDLWIEEKYQHDTSFEATYMNTHKWGPSKKVYTKGYKEWLEKRECQKPN